MTKLILKSQKKGNLKPKWSLPKPMQGLHSRVEQDLRIAREALAHPVARGDTSETVWVQLFQKYLPKRYAIDKATICDSKGAFREQMDVVIYDRQYTPFIFEHKGELVIPAESVYAAFESKQEINSRFIEYAQQKLRTVRSLHRTSAEIRKIDSLHTAALQPILGGFLAFENGWKQSPAGKFMSPALLKEQDLGQIDSLSKNAVRDSVRVSVRNASQARSRPNCGRMYL